MVCLNWLFGLNHNFLVEFSGSGREVVEAYRLDRATKNPPNCQSRQFGGYHVRPTWA